MLNTLSERPDEERLKRFLERLLRERGEEVEFVVLFGSMARGDWGWGSDYDLFIGLRGEDGRRMLDRLAEFTTLVEGNIEVFPYSRAEWERMVESFHPLLLEVLADGIVLWDRGAFHDLRTVFQQWRAEGMVERWRQGWKIGVPA